MKIKKSHLKSIINEIVRELVLEDATLTPIQRKVVDTLQKRGFKVVKSVPSADGQTDIILQNKSLNGKGIARIHHNGTINNNNTDVNKFLTSLVGEGMTTRAELDQGVMKAVNVEEEELEEQTGTGAVAGYSTPFAFSKKKDGSGRAIQSAKKYGKVVKNISENEK